MFLNATQNALSPLDGFKRHLANTKVGINYAEGCKLWSNDESGFPEAVAAAQKSDHAVVVVGTWTRDQTQLWYVFFFLWLITITETNQRGL